jgi:hypothetical protein
MLTLDRITLFYHDLREASRAQLDDPLDDVADWAAKVPTKEPGRIRTTASTPSLAGISERTRSSTVAKSSNTSTFRGNVSVRIAGNEDGLSEDEEAREGGNIPAKRKGRNSSSVSWKPFFLWYRLTGREHRLRSRIKKLANESRTQTCLQRRFSIIRGVTRSYQHCSSGREPNAIHLLWVILIFAMLS